MNDLGFEQRVREAARAAADAVPVPPVPAALRQLRARSAPPRAAFLWSAAAAAAVAFMATTDGGRAAIAFVEHTVRVFSIDPDTGKRLPVTAISLQEALSTPAFPVIEPQGLPAGSQLELIQRLGDPETGRPSVLFRYAVNGRGIEIFETRATASGNSANQKVQVKSAVLEPHGALVRLIAPRPTIFRTFVAGETRIIVTVPVGSLSTAQIDAVRKAMIAQK